MEDLDITSSWLQCWQKQLLKLLLSPQLDMDVRDEEAPHSSWPFNLTPTGKKAEINFLNFKNASEMYQEIMEAVPARCLRHLLLAPLSLSHSLYYSFSSLNSVFLAHFSSHYSLPFLPVTPQPLAFPESSSHITLMWGSHIIFDPAGCLCLAGVCQKQGETLLRTLNMLPNELKTSLSFYAVLYHNCVLTLFPLLSFSSAKAEPEGTENPPGQGWAVI